MNTIRVALVEDHTLTRVGIRTALQQRDQIEVVGEASNALSALELLKITPTDVAIVDVGLPGMDGIELTQRLKSIPPAGEVAETKVLIMTMQDDEEVVMSAFAAGADSYCMKDISINDLVEAIRVTSHGDSWIDPSVARIVLRQTREAQAEAFSKADSGTIAIKAMDNEYDQVVQAYPLTERELEVLELIVDGCSNAKIAERLYITVGTVKTHVRNILNKLCADDRTQLAVRALRSGLVK
jgi:DNA-binding NarL/FixJ family response regulator